jgi:tripartite-type tricarboxylate transporter receptor subunit TctC
VTSVLAAYSTVAGHLSSAKVRAMATVTKTRIEALPDVRTVAESGSYDYHLDFWLARRQVMAWPFTAPPGVPQERIGVLREAFMDTMKDKDLPAEAATASFEIRPVSGADIQRLLHEAYAAPAAVVQRAARLLQ